MSQKISCNRIAVGRRKGENDRLLSLVALIWWFVTGEATMPDIQWCLTARNIRYRASCRAFSTPRTVNVMANGMVVNPVSVIAELDRLHQQGVTDYQLFISNRAAMVMPGIQLLTVLMRI